MEPDPAPESEVWWIGAIYLAANSVLALGSEVRSQLGLQLAASLAAGTLVFVLAGLTGRCGRVPEPVP